jgi:hypothetical protein
MSSKNYEEIGYGLHWDLLSPRANHMFHILGEVGLVGKRNQLRPIYLIVKLLNFVVSHAQPLGVPKNVEHGK